MQEGLYCQQDERRLKNVQVQTTQVETRVTVVDIIPNINDERRERQDYQDSQEILRQVYQQPQKDLKIKDRKKKEKETKENLQLAELKLAELKLAELKLAEQQEPEMAPEINTTPQLQAHQVQPTKLQAYAMEQEEHPTHDALVEQKTKQEECRKHVDLPKEIGQQEEYHRPEDVIKKLEDKREESKRSALNKEREERKRSTLNKEREERKRSTLNKEREERKRSTLNKEREERHRYKALLGQSETYSVLPTKTQQEEQQRRECEEQQCREEELFEGEVYSFSSNASSSSLGSETLQLNQSLLNAFNNTRRHQSNIPSSIKEQEQDKEQSREIKQRIQQIREKLSSIDEVEEENITTIANAANKLHDDCLFAINSKIFKLSKKFQMAKKSLHEFKQNQYENGYLEEAENNSQAISSNQYGFRS